MSAILFSSYSNSICLFIHANLLAHLYTYDLARCLFYYFSPSGSFWEEKKQNIPASYPASSLAIKDELFRIFQTNWAAVQVLTKWRIYCKYKYISR